MRVTKTKFDRGGGFFVQFDGEKWVAVEAKRFMLEWGGAFLVARVEDRFPQWEFRFPAFGEYPSLPVHRGTTDPSILCLARRARTVLNMTPVDGSQRALDVPDGKEAIAELQSGQDIYGGEWPVPLSTLEPLDDTIRAAR